MSRGRRAAPRLLFCNVLVAAALSGCAARQWNEALETAKGDAGYRFKVRRLAADERDPLLVFLTFSGGGTRAAALSYGVLEKLRQIHIELPGSAGEPIRLLDEVDFISSVSGGSFTAAYYALFGDRLFDDFAEQFLQRHFQGQLFRGVFLNPVNWFRLGSPHYSRIDVAAKLYDKQVFEGKVFADLPRDHSRPIVVINATNIATGEQFSFTQGDFDLLGSDLDSYPIANAVAASSAFPVLLNSVTLQNHPAPPGYELPKSLSKHLDSPDPRRRLTARSQAMYHLDKEGHPYMHLIDGGLSDNLGLRFVLEKANALLNQPGLEHILVIAVNARNNPTEDVDQRSSPPGLISMLYKAGTISMGKYSGATIAAVRALFEARERDADVVGIYQQKIDAFYDKLMQDAGTAACRDEIEMIYSGIARPEPIAPIQLHLVEVQLDDIPDPARRQEFLDMPTSLGLDRESVERLTAMGQDLLAGNEAFQDFLESVSTKE